MGWNICCCFVLFLFYGFGCGFLFEILFVEEGIDVINKFLFGDDEFFLLLFILGGEDSIIVEFKGICEFNVFVLFGRVVV